MIKYIFTILSIYVLIIGVVFSFLLGNSSYAQPYWLRSAGSQLIDEGTDVTTDLLGNVYVTGYFSGTADFGGVFVVSQGITDVFTLKYNSSGALQWVKTGGGSGNDRGLSIITDNSGSCFVTGYFYGTAVFGVDTIISSGSQDIFVAKYNTSGVLQWIKRAGGTLSDVGNAITSDTFGNVIVTGQFSGTAQFDSQSLTSMNNPTNGLPSFDIFVAKYNSAGNLVWVKQGSAPYTDRGIDVGADSAGNVYVTGQFSDTITFDQIHYNNMFNAIFLIKYDSIGNEVWFRMAGSSDQCISYGIAVDDSSNIYLTGDFLNNIFFIGNIQFTLSNTYFNNIFLTKYNGNGELLWAVADGSESEVSARNIALDELSNAYIIGNFRCRFSEYSEVFGGGTFNSVGYNDVYVTKYDPTGSRIWMRNFGSRKDDCGAGISAFITDNPVVVGSFISNLYFPTSGFINGNSYHSSLAANYGKSICGDNNYGYFSSRSSFGNQDIFIAKAIDLSREPYDYYNRINGTCDRSFVNCCIHSGPTLQNSVCGTDTLSGCDELTLTTSTNTTSQYTSSFSNVGPIYSYLWSDGYPFRSRTVSSSGWHYVTITSEDGCFTSRDSAFAEVFDLPSIPSISDNLGININATNPEVIYYCGDSLILSGGNFGNNTFYWTATSDTGNTDITATHCGFYSFVVVDSNGCSNSNTIEIHLVDTLPPADIHLFLHGDDDRNDSIEICSGDFFIIYAYDSLLYPNGNCLCSLANDADAIFNITSNIPGDDTCYVGQIFYPTLSDFYTVNAEVYYTNACGGDTFHLSKTVFVTVYPIPDLEISISAATSFCPGSNIMLTATGTEVMDSIVWNGNGIIGNRYNDTIYINQSGTYSVKGFSTNSFGCSDSDMVYINIPLISQPIISMFPINGIICPGQDVILSVTGGPNYEWYGPMGLISGNTSSVNVNMPGFYYCVVTNSNGCTMLSNTVEIKEFATPYLQVMPNNTTLCFGDSAIINVITNSGSNIQWQAPFSGSSMTQVVYSPGVYYCNITSCGILTNASATVSFSNITATITSSGPLEFCSDDSLTLFCGTQQASWYWLPGGISDSGITAYASGTYSLFVTDIHGCSDSDSVDVIMHVNPTIIVTADTICSGNTATLFANSDPGLIQWYNQPSGGSPLSTGNTFNTPVLIDTSYFYVQVTDSYCSSIMTPAIVIVNPLPIAFDIGGGGNYCAGGAGVSITLNGSQTDVSYQIQIDGVDYGLPVVGNNNILDWNNQTIAGNYSIIGTNTVTGCIQTMSGNANVYINVNPVADAGNDQTIPNGTSTTIIGSATGGSGLYTWSWSPSDSVVSYDVENPTTVNLGSTTVFLLIVTDTLTGCTGTDEVIVFITGSPLAVNVIAFPDTICVNTTVQLVANASGGSGTYSYSWSSNPMGFSSSDYNPSDSPVVSTIYTVSVNDGYSTYNSSVNVVVIDSLSEINPVISSNSPVCVGEGLNLYSDAVLGCQYNWTGPLGFTSTNEDPYIAYAETGHSGIYSLYVYSGGCNSQTVSINIIVNPNPEIILSNDTLICPGDTIELHAAGGTSVLWTPVNILSSNTSFNPLAYPQQSTTFNAIITDLNGCTDSGNILIMTQNDFFVDYGTNTAIIIGESTGLFVTADQNNVTYLWIPSETLNCDTCTTPIATPLETTEYSVIVTDSLGCVSISGHVLIEVIKEYTLDLPSLFTPDGDGVNDVVYVRGWGLKELIWFRIYNRWGEMIFETSDLNTGWDGTFNGKPQNIESYAYHVKAYTLGGHILTKKGYITLIR